MERQVFFTNRHVIPPGGYEGVDLDKTKLEYVIGGDQLAYIAQNDRVPYYFNNSGNFYHGTHFEFSSHCNNTTYYSSTV